MIEHIIIVVVVVLAVEHKITKMLRKLNLEIFKGNDFISFYINSNEIINKFS